MKHVVIIGNGVSGITAARHIRKMTDHRITVISSETPYFFSRTALMYIYMGQLTFEHTKPYEDSFWKKNRIDLVFDHATKIDHEQKSLHLRSDRRIHYDDLIIACGSTSNLPGIPGEQLKGVQALYGYQDLLQMQQLTANARNAVIVGGGLIGVEMAEMLHSRKVAVTMIVREPAYWNNVLPLAAAKIISKHISTHGVNIKHNEEVEEFLSDDNGKLFGVRTRSGDEIACDFAGIAIGVRPNIEWLRDSGLSIGKGVLVNEYLETNIHNIYAVGDCVERQYELEGRRTIEQVWYTARMMGEVVAQTICGNPTRYEPGPWFNSAKFFDIEFQTYGNAGSEPAEDEREFYWEHPSGKKAMHIVWQKETNIFRGINSFGIRLRHESFDRWLRDKKSVDYVMDHLAEANFDPEFTERNDGEIRQQFKRQINRTPVEQ